LNSEGTGEGRKVAEGSPRVHRLTLIQMNLAAFTARRDAAHERTVEVLLAMTPTMSKRNRVLQYTLCLCLLDEAILASRRSQARHDTPLMHYFRFLRDTVAAALAMVKHEIMVVEESEVFSRLADPDFVHELTTAGDVFSAGERNIRNSIRDLLKLGRKICSEDTRERRKQFRDGDAERYRTTLGEYRRFYREFRPKCRMQHVE